ncbi:MAG TPA: rod shape-determining protein [Gaiellaceae bacterium]|jgi:rod shape-determining protein MreB|nr:rod shape-determining protein [Gaiellaceae bacterium]
MRFPGHLRRARGDDIAVDLGTANTVVFVRGHGIALFEPSVVAVDETTGEVLAVGEEARRMIGRTPAAIRATRPLRHGVIADFEVTEGMLRHFMRRTIGTGRRHPRVILCVPSGITEVERRAVEEATLVAGAREARLIEEPMAAAIGADLPIAEPRASMIVDIGGGTTEVAVISLGGMVVWESIRVGGYEMDEAIVDHVKKQYGLLIGQERAEEAKIAIGSAVDTDELQEAEVAGRDMISGLLRRLLVRSDELRHALEGPIARIVDAVKDTLERTPPELSADVMERGIVLAGGGALLQGMSERLRGETGLPVHVVDSPLTCVAVGAGRSLEEFEAISRSSAGRPLRRGL